MIKYIIIYVSMQSTLKPGGVGRHCLFTYMRKRGKSYYDSYPFVPFIPPYCYRILLCTSSNSAFISCSAFFKLLSAKESRPPEAPPEATCRSDSVGKFRKLTSVNQIRATI